MMKGKALSIFSLLLLTLSLLESGCSTDFEVNAPERDIRAVYSILDPADTVQYIRIARVYQVEGDAIAYGGENDMSVKGLDVRITRTSDGHVYNAVEVDSFPKEEGIFFPTYTAYKIVTDGSTANPAIRNDNQYQLEIGAPDSEGYLTAYTVVPGEPELRGTLSIIAGAGNQRCLPKMSLKEPLNISWVRTTAFGYELRTMLRFAANGVQDSILWGPTDVITENNRCNEGSGRLCYQFNEEVLLNYFLARMPQDGTIYTYDNADSCIVNPTNDPAINDLLPKAWEFQVTGMDEFLYKYSLANDPKFLDLTGAKPEYTNLTGNIQGVGVFGSISTSTRYAIFRPCTEYLLGLNGTPAPPGCQ